MRKKLYIKIKSPMSPTLNMIVERDSQIKNFKSEPFYNLQIGNSDVNFLSERMTDKEEIDTFLEEYWDNSDNRLVIENITSKEKIEKPPQLYDLTTLQREANRKLGIGETVFSNKLIKIRKRTLNPVIFLIFISNNAKTVSPELPMKL